MKQAFHHANGGEVEENGKLAAGFAVIVGHVVPFMGAQTTIAQRYFLPHPADTIASQPFGMTEDLVSMAMAEAVSNPVLASQSLTVLIVFFNLARGLVFSMQKSEKPLHLQAHRSINDDIVGIDSEVPAKTPLAESPEHHAEEHSRDWLAVAEAILNVLVGLVFARIISGGMSLREAFRVVAFQMMIQLFIVPIMLRCISTLLLKFYMLNKIRPSAPSPQLLPDLAGVVLANPTVTCITNAWTTRS